MKKAFISIVLAVLTLFPLAACGTKAPEKSKVDHVYKANDLGLGNVRADNILANGKTVVVSGDEILDADSDSSQYVVISVDISSGKDEISPVKRVIDLAANEAVSGTALEADGNVLLLKSETDGNGKMTYSLDRLGDDIVTVCADVNSLVGSDGSDSMFTGKNTYFGYLAVDGDGKIYIGCDYAIAVLDRECNKLFEISVPGRMDMLSSTADGRVWASFRDDSYNEQIRFIDTETKKFGDTLNLPDMSGYTNVYLFVGPGYDVYIKDDDAVHGWNSDADEPVELLNFMNSDFAGSSVSSGAVIDADTMVFGCSDFYGASPEYGVYLMTRVPDNKVPEKTIVCLAYRFSGLPTLRKNVIAFNRQSDEYRIELVDYNRFEPVDEYDYDNSKLLERDLMSDRAPDIVQTSDFSAAGEWIDKGAFTDLSEYMTDDMRSGYFGSVLSMCEDADKRMYQFVTDFMVNTVSTSTKYVAPEHWDIDAFLDFAAGLPDGKYLMENTYPMNLLTFTLSGSLDNFIDFGTAECDFDTPTFRRLLEYLNGVEKVIYEDTLSGDDLRDYEIDRMKPYREGTVLLTSISAADLRYYLQDLTNFGKDTTNFVGYPVSVGSSHNGTLLEPSLSFAVNEKSGLKDAAWEFIRFVAENGTLSDNGFPANVERFDRLHESDIGKYYYFEGYKIRKYGKLPSDEVEADLNERIRSGEYDGSGALVKIDETTIASLKDLINGAGAYPDAVEKIIDMIYEESQMYFEGDKSLDDTVKIIQDRVSTYLSERE